MKRSLLFIVCLLCISAVYATDISRLEPDPEPDPEPEEPEEPDNGDDNSGDGEDSGDDGDYSEPDPEPQERHCQYCGMSESEYDEFGYDCDYAEGHIWIY